MTPIKAIRVEVVVANKKVYEFVILNVLQPWSIKGYRVGNLYSFLPFNLKWLGHQSDHIELSNKKCTSSLLYSWDVG